MPSDASLQKFGRDYRAGEVLFEEGEIGQEMFVIQEGRIQVTKRIGGEVRPLAMLGRGDFLGEMAILNNKPRNATATVVEDARCLVIDAQTLETMVSHNSEIAVRLIKRLAGRLDAADALVQILMNPDPQARVMLALRRRAETHGEQADEGTVVHVTPDVLAQEAGAAVADVESVLRRLARLDIARAANDDDAIVIADVGRLLEFLDFLDLPPPRAA